MAEYIDKELAIEGMWAGLKEGTICGPEDTETFLHSLPAADVEPVIHAHWISKVEIVRNRYAQNYYCSNCLHKQLEISNHCPCCGAKMDGEVTQDG